MKTAFLPPTFDRFESALGYFIFQSPDFSEGQPQNKACELTATETPCDHKTTSDILPRCCYVRVVLLSSEWVALVSLSFLRILIWLYLRCLRCFIGFSLRMAGHCVRQRHFADLLTCLQHCPQIKIILIDRLPIKRKKTFQKSCLFDFKQENHTFRIRPIFDSNFHKMDSVRWSLLACKTRNRNGTHTHDCVWNKVGSRQLSSKGQWRFINLIRTWKHIFVSYFMCNSKCLIYILFFRLVNFIKFFFFFFSYFLCYDFSIEEGSVFSCHSRINYVSILAFASVCGVYMLQFSSRRRDMQSEFRCLRSGEESTCMFMHSNVTYWKWKFQFRKCNEEHIGCETLCHLPS